MTDTTFIFNKMDCSCFYFSYGPNQMQCLVQIKGLKYLLIIVICKLIVKYTLIFSFYCWYSLITSGNYICTE